MSTRLPDADPVDTPGSRARRVCLVADWTSDGVTVSGPPAARLATVPQDLSHRFLRLRIELEN